MYSSWQGVIITCAAAPGQQYCLAHCAIRNRDYIARSQNVQMISAKAATRVDYANGARVA